MTLNDILNRRRSVRHYDEAAPLDAEINMIVACGIRKAGHDIWGERFRLPFGEIYREI